jgi:hypothetical protein
MLCVGERETEKGDMDGGKALILNKKTQKKTP